MVRRARRQKQLHPLIVTLVYLGRRYSRCGRVRLFVRQTLAIEVSSQRRAYSLWAIVVYCAFALTRPDGKKASQTDQYEGTRARCTMHEARLPPSFAVRSVRICPFQLSNKRGDRHVGANGRYLLSTCDSCPQLWTWKCNSNSKVGWGEYGIWT